MTRNLEHLTPIMATKLNLGFERWWDSSTDWKNVKAWDSCLKLIAGASNRAFCGSPLCRDEQFLDHLQTHAMNIFVGTMIINISPKPFKPFKPISGFLVGKMVCNGSSISAIPQAIHGN
ncbi:hypothetical protein HYFRA_00010673 [Hymenoscyphus fraxineus]|uniref:Uncharacterized protein n=1 Tax=Hymenoscyphus fraxineus TaxID=746836 RepID=A0A9N9L666_9HELO|nr:hypothetical protein HYFRA_00010673 [Hymenoscyphus fraxineus]